MIAMTVDRCYDRYVIALSGLDEAAETPELAAGLLGRALREMLEERREHGGLRALRICEQGGELTLDAEAAPGQEESLAAAVDAVTTGMCLLAEEYPELIDVET